MKLISCIIFSVILAPLVFGVPLPQSQPPLQGATAAAQPIVNAQTVNGGIAFTQQFMQLLGMLFNNFNTIVPRFVNLFTGQSPSAAGLPSPGQSIPSLSNIPGVPSLQSLQPEKFNNLPKVQPKSPRDTELNTSNNDPNDILNDAVDILSI